eukprot:XP_028344074.1 uncharacterized protein LOC114486089 [Physeter catodon]
MGAEADDSAPKAPQAGVVCPDEATPNSRPECGQNICELNRCVVCGLLTGAVAAALFTPYDKALFLSITSARPFLDRSIWHKPYQGLANTFLYRAVNTGIYYPLESRILKLLSSGPAFSITSRQKQQKEAQEKTEMQYRSRTQQEATPSSASTLALTGQLAGVASALLCHPLNMIKYASWSNHARNSSEAFFWSMRHGGINERRARLCASFSQNTLAASLGVLLSSPFNYVRNMQLAAPLHCPPPSFRDIVVSLLHQVKQESQFWKKGALLVNRFRVGWGTLRASTGVSTGAYFLELSQHEDRIKPRDLELATTLFEAAKLSSGFEVDNPKDIAHSIYKAIGSELGYKPMLEALEDKDLVNEYVPVSTSEESDEEAGDEKASTDDDLDEEEEDKAEQKEEQEEKEGESEHDEL